MKKNTFNLDIDLEDESPLLEASAYLFFHTSSPSYLLVDDLNHLYHLSLSRLDDITLPQGQWPFYSFYDHLRLLHYYLVDLSVTPQNANNQTITQSKLLLLRGEDADNVADTILHDFNLPLPSPDPLNPDQLRRNDILLSYQQQLVSVTRYDPQAPAALSRKAAKERLDLDNLLTATLDYIDIHHL